MKKASTTGRNEFVAKSAESLISRVDALIAGTRLQSHVPASVQSVFDANIPVGGSVRLACAFFSAYAVQDLIWDYDSIPIGIRGKYGDKRLAAALTERHVTFHQSITAFGENLGWKGNVSQFRLSTDDRFSDFIAQLKALSFKKKSLLLEHVAWVLYDSRKVPSAMPRLPNKYLTYSRACLLCNQLLGLNTQGHVQQLLVAAFLSVHRARSGIVVRTHHPHASDTFGNAVGDIEEFVEERLIMAYEVTVRDDWKNRLPDLQAKSARGHLSKYVLIARGVTSDKQLFPAEALVTFTRTLMFDLAIVDIDEFFRVFCAELTKDELISAFNRAYEFLCDPKLSGKHEYIDAYKKKVSHWIEQP